MAASKLTTPEEILDELGEDFLTCPICLEQYKSPKILPCHHSFCQLCLEILVEKTQRLDCPTCQRSVQLPGSGVTGLDSNFFMNSMLEVVKKRTDEVADQSERKCEFCEETEASVFCVDCEQYYCDKCAQKVHKKLKLAATNPHEILTTEEYKTRVRKKPSTVRGYENCKVHPKNEIKYYCDTCKIPVCSECTIIDHRAPDHSHIRHLHEVADECLSVLVQNLKVKAREVDQSTADVKYAFKKVIEQYMVNKQKVRKQSDALIDKIEKQESKLIEKLDINCKLQVKGLQSDISELQLKCENLTSTCSYIEALVHHLNAVQCVSKSQSVKARLEKIVTMGTITTEHELVEFLPSDDITTDGILGLLRSDVCISLCSVDNIAKCLLKGESINMQITTKDRSGKPVIPRQAVEVTLTKPDGSKTNLDVTDNRDGTHTVTANTDGKYQVAMTIGDQEVPGSPFDIPVIKGLVKTLGKKGNSKGEFNAPCGLAINKNGDLVVADTNNKRIQIIDIDANFQKAFKFKKFGKSFRPMGVAVSADDRYFMTDWYNKQVVVSDEDGEVITTFGQNELKHPNSISISPLDGAVCVSDWDGKGGAETNKDGHCIRKYTQDGKYIKSFGKYGEENGEFKGPGMMVHDNQGMMFIVDCENCRIQVFDADDNFLYKFGTMGKEDGQLFGPYGVCIDSDRYVYVGDCSQRIQKFDSSGRFICRVDCEDDGLNELSGLAISEGVPWKVAVTDISNHCIRLYVH